MVRFRVVMHWPPALNCSKISADLGLDIFMYIKWRMWQRNEIVLRRICQQNPRLSSLKRLTVFIHAYVQAPVPQCLSGMDVWSHWMTGAFIIMALFRFWSGYVFLFIYLSLGQYCVFSFNCDTILKFHIRSSPSGNMLSSIRFLVYLGTQRNRLQF